MKGKRVGDVRNHSDETTAKHEKFADYESADGSQVVVEMGKFRVHGIGKGPKRWKESYQTRVSVGGEMVRQYFGNELSERDQGDVQAIAENAETYGMSADEVIGRLDDHSAGRASDLDNLDELQ
ncbi:hypothetical protein HOA55_04780 [archaeon]|jgi:hypothetical protein|nr:hypothetical protein [archaeon]MBT3578096.1 hypothetical protein [archaeon]MBT6820644.1 hypothetical protein [archaeon]MBT6956487.1 hypothetical protein [archaeon]MBT7024946.1 hypothetical protein [archaeon]